MLRISFSVNALKCWAGALAVAFACVPFPTHIQTVSLVPSLRFFARILFNPRSLSKYNVDGHTTCFVCRKLYLDV